MVVSFPTFLNDRVLIIIQECFKGVGHGGDDLLECVQEAPVVGAGMADIKQGFLRVV